MLSDLCCGIDILFIPRFKKLIADSQFKLSIFSARELLMSDTSLAGNFAVKEAYLKALKTGENIKDLRLLEVLRNDLGAPYLYSDDVEIQRAIDKVWSISMSHDNQYCVGIVLARNENH